MDGFDVRYLLVRVCFVLIEGEKKQRRPVTSQDSAEQFAEIEQET